MFDRSPIVIDERSYGDRTFAELLVSTRSGSRLHQQGAGSSVTACGHWQRADGHHFAVKAYNRRAAARVPLCEKCFPPGSPIEQRVRDLLSEVS